MTTPFGSKTTETRPIQEDRRHLGAGPPGVAHLHGDFHSPMVAVTPVTHQPPAPPPAQHFARPGGGPRVLMAPACRWPPILHKHRPAQDESWSAQGQPACSASVTSGSEGAACQDATISPRPPHRSAAAALTTYCTGMVCPGRGRAPSLHHPSKSPHSFPVYTHGTDSEGFTCLGE